MIVITGAAGFIGSCLAGFLNKQGEENLLIVDDFGRNDKLLNYSSKKFQRKIERSVFLEWFAKNHSEVDFVFHIGARTDTAETDKSVFDELNLNYSKRIWEICSKFRIPLIYASSAATYGSGNLGFDDNHEVIEKLKPLNPYGESKNEFDKWAIHQKASPTFWAGLKFFNVYGPNEYHKGRMASVVYHAFRQISETGKMSLFRSHRTDFKDGEQARDFIYAEDVLKVCYFLYQHQPASGIYNVGTGKARTFLDLAKALFIASGKKPVIEFIDTPKDIRNNYQYFTEAEISKLKDAGYHAEFTTLESGIKDYVQRYLLPKNYY